MFGAESLGVGGVLLRQRTRAVLVLAVGGAALGLLRAFDPSAVALVPPCPFYALAGLYCPGCGSLRALHQALHGNLGAALGLNLLAVLIVPFLAYHLALRVVAAFSRRDLASPLEYGHAARIVLIAVVAFWVLRNMPFYPFSVLAPQ